jgi:hypothetical protein
MERLVIFFADELAPNGPSDLGLPEVTVSAGVPTLLNVVFLGAGILAVVFIIIGGFKYTISGGDASGIKSAKETITYAIIGLIVTLLAFGIVNYITGIRG